MVKTQISHPTSRPLISGFDWHTPPFFSLLSVCFSCCWLCLSVCVITRSQQPWACLPQPYWIHSPYSPPPPLFSLSQDEGPQHLISTSAVKVQRLLALLHIMKEGWSLDPAGNPPKDWVTERGIPELSFLSLFFFLLSSQMPFFPYFALASVEEDFLQRPTFCCCFLDMMGKKNLYRLIMLKACILTQDIDKHTYKHTDSKPNIHM